MKRTSPRPSPRVAILGTGDELVRGRSRDTNTPWIAGAATEAGCRVVGTHVVGDDPRALAEAFRRCARGADHVVVTGGLGPTKDDLTRAMAARVLGVDLRVHGPSLRHIRALWSRRGRPMPESNAVQALLPRGARAIPNAMGSAPGFRFTLGAAVFHCLPGVPREMVPMFEEAVLPLLRRAARGNPTQTRRISLFGLSESEFGERVADLMGRERAVAVGTSVKDGVIRVSIHGQGAAAASVEAVHGEILRRVGPAAFSVGDESPGEVALAAARRAGLTLATAESCTGGLVAKRLTDAPGASDVVLGGVTAYANEAKVRLLGVSPDLLARHGAVSGPVAEAMARGARRRFAAGLAVAVTGIAGPGGGSPEKPVGTVWLGVAGPRGVRSVLHRFAGSRGFIRSIAANAALDLLRREASEMD